MKWRRRESNPLLLGASEVLCRQSLVPRWLLRALDTTYAQNSRAIPARQCPPPMPALPASASDVSINE
jgi:hypothetical protein